MANQYREKAPWCNALDEAIVQGHLEYALRVGMKIVTFEKNLFVEDCQTLSIWGLLEQGWYQTEANAFSYKPINKFY